MNWSLIRRHRVAVLAASAISIYASEQPATPVCRAVSPDAARFFIANLTLCRHLPAILSYPRLPAKPIPLALRFILVLYINGSTPSPITPQIAACPLVIARYSLNDGS